MTAAWALGALLLWASLGSLGCAAPGTRTTAEEVRLRIGKDAVAGVLDLPSGPGPHPAILLVPGSGPADREFPLYLALARHWVSRGIAVLRYDKRGTGRSSGDWSRETFLERAADVSALAGWLREHRDIRPDRVGLCGHSQGGWIAPLAASRDPEVAFLVILAGAAVTPAEQDLSSTRHKILQAGLGESAAEEAVAFKRDLHRIARDRKASEEELGRLIAGVSNRPWFPHVMPPDLRLDQIALLLRYLALIMDHDPVPVLERIGCPVLAIFGERDPYAAPSENAARMEQALRRGSPDVSVQVIPGMGHRLESADGGGEGFALGALEALDSWLDRRIRAPLR